MENAKRRRIFALATVGYLGLLYGTLDIIPYFFRWLFQLFGRGSYSHSITAFLVFFGVVVLFRCRKQLATLGPWRWIFLFAVGLGYAAIISTVRVPTTQLHSIQYGLLVWLIMESLRGTMPLSGIYTVSFAFTMMAAGADEYLQSLLPSRNGMFAHVLLDGFAVFLAQVSIAIIHDLPTDKEFSEKSLVRKENRE